MKNKINLFLIEYAINSLFRAKTKSLFILTIFTILIFLLTSIFLIANSIKYELNSTVNSLPQIIIQNTKGGRLVNIDTQMTDELLEINGVSDVTARVWGYYYFANAKVNFTLVGLDNYENQYKQSLERLIKKYDFEKLNSGDCMLVGSGVKKIMEKNYYNSYFNFIKPDGSLEKIKITGVFKDDIGLESNDMIILSKDTLRNIFDLDEDKATDIVVKVSNPKEIPTVAKKIQYLYPNVKIITNEDLKIGYQNIFNYKSGIFLSFFIVALFTFFMIVYDKSSGLSSEEKKEIGILKAIGWKINDVLKGKFYESFIISFLAYLLGIIFAFGYVYIFEAIYLRDIFMGFDGLKPVFNLPFVFDIQTLALVFFLSVPIYICATIIPSWRTATLETDEVIR